mmetsp:Transcript_128/g.342  ORF Transcript_128/g.342 Transcript_128/m.342 type:complete len:84 (+) Transcript_128:300-551(+)|eukprot:CAMPEP_0204259220 /NCGR_PEP_ID=MMETSP0468-20130131/5484_1 /ASSEMBLY_ACC=CAM_ASM_000383 /TAXON_ID=2969 /ORGANISM="Oxyrrhis marina" /LENGTH=83 /DNA_ID=CAMNT_0051233477 /DNA_START=270 /DNA_END=521 /DNA_ORIENTATION=-
MKSTSQLTDVQAHLQMQRFNGVAAEKHDHQPDSSCAWERPPWAEPLDASEVVSLCQLRLAAVAAQLRETFGRLLRLGSRQAPV